jgi:predicted DNA-binding transcriptional regulator AlpA
MNGQTINTSQPASDAEIRVGIDGFLRLKDIIRPNGPIPVGKSTWWAGVKNGRFPKGYKLGPGTTVWRCQDIRDLIERTAATRDSSQFTVNR